MAAQVWAFPNFPVTFNDALAANVPSDVVGNPEWFDIYSVQFQTYNPVNNTMQIAIRFNYGGGLNLNSFTVGGVTLNVGDFILGAGGDQYAFVLTSHDGLAAGNTYKINGTQTAKTALGDPSSINYRPDAPVWANGAGASYIGSGGLNTSLADATSTHLLTTLTVQMNNAMRANLENGFDFSFASATCGNDLITGSLAAGEVPEPGSYALIAVGLAGLALLRRRS
jgi:hypothetical protein